MAHEENQLNAGNMKKNNYEAQYAVCKIVLEYMPASVPLDSIGLLHFTSVMNAIIKRKQAPQTRGRVIGLVKSIFKFGYENGVLSRPANFGVGFAKPPAKVMRAHRNAKGDQSIRR